MKSIRFDRDWLERRLRLFEAFTYPSVLAQTNQNFRWLGLVHPDSPQWFLDRVSAYDKLEMVPVEYDLNAVIRGGKTINLDTDDAIAKNFIEAAHRVTFVGETIFERGIIYRIYTRAWLSTKAPRSHFNVINHREVTVLDYSHGMGVLDKKVVNTSQPMWLEVIHEENIANKMKSTSRSKNMGYKAATEHIEIASEQRVLKLNEQNSVGVAEYGRFINDN